MLVLYIPLITWPLPSSNSIGSPLSKLESKTVPSVSFPCPDNNKLIPVKETGRIKMRALGKECHQDPKKYSSSIKAMTFKLNSHHSD